MFPQSAKSVATLHVLVFSLESDVTDSPGHVVHVADRIVYHRGLTQPKPPVGNAPDVAQHNNPPPKGDAINPARCSPMKYACHQTSQCDQSVLINEICPQIIPHHLPFAPVDLAKQNQPIRHLRYSARPWSLQSAATNHHRHGKQLHRFPCYRSTQSHQLSIVVEWHCRYLPVTHRRRKSFPAKDIDVTSHHPGLSGSKALGC